MPIAMQLRLRSPACWWLAACLAAAFTPHIASGQTASGQTAAAPTAANQDQTVSMPEFDVNAYADKGYESGNAVGATKTNTPILDLAFSVDEINPELLADLNPNETYDAVRYISSVSQGDTRTDTPIIRGFAATIANDGLLAASGFNGTIDMANIERMEVVKGASAVMYGSVQTGGLINLVHKVANDTPSQSVELTYGSYDFYRGIIDVNQPLLKTASDELDYRLIIDAQDSQSYQDFTHEERYLISNNVTFKAGQNTAVTLRVDYYDIWGLNNPSVAYDFNGVLLNSPLTFYRGEPSEDWQHNHYVTAELIAEQKFNEDWSFKFSTNYTADNEYRREVFLNTPPANPTQWVRYEQTILQQFDGDVSEGDLLGNFTVGPFKNKVLLGGYTMALQNPTMNARYGPLTPNFNVIDPVYGPGIYTIGPIVTSAFREFFDQSYDWAVFAQDQIQTLNDRLFITLGGRTDYNQITNTNLSPYATAGSQLVFTQTYTKTSPRVAGLFKITDGLSAYVSYDESFVPAPGTDSFYGVPLPPPTAEQKEAGLKYALFNGRLSGSVSTFTIDRNNVQAADPINPGNVIAVGQVKTTGWEADATGFITDHWQIYGGYGHYHNWDAVDTTAANIGELFEGTPWWTMGVFTKYDFKGTPLDGFDVGVGVTGMSGIPINTGRTGPFTPASYTLDPEVSYTWKNWRLQLQVENALNNIYFVYATSDRYAQPGQPRTVYFTVSYKH